MHQQCHQVSESPHAGSHGSLEGVISRSRLGKETVGTSTVGYQGERTNKLAETSELEG